MVWSIETDDFHGTCDGTPFTLIKTIVEAMNGPIVIPTTPAPFTTPSTTPTSPTTVPTTSRPTTSPTTSRPTTSPTYPTTISTGPTTRPTITPTTSPTVYTRTSTIPTGPTTSRRPTTPHNICKSEGLFADPDDCHSFYQCSRNAEGGWIIEVYQCAQGTVFNPELGSCDWPYNVPGCESAAF